MKCEKCNNEEFITMSLYGQLEADQEPYKNGEIEELKEEHEHLNYSNVNVNVCICSKCNNIVFYDSEFL